VKKNALASFVDFIYVEKKKNSNMAKKMVNSPGPKTLRFLADILESATAPDGFGFIADSCLVAYCADDGVDYDEAKAYLDKNYPHKEIYDEETWILDPRTTWDQVKAITDECY